MRRFETKELVAPCLLTNDLSSIVRLRVRSPRYHAVCLLPRRYPRHAVALAGFRILVKRKQGHLSHAADPHGLRSVHAKGPPLALSGAWAAGGGGGIGGGAMVSGSGGSGFDGGGMGVGAGGALAGQLVGTLSEDPHLLSFARHLAGVSATYFAGSGIAGVTTGGGYDAVAKASLTASNSASSSSSTSETAAFASFCGDALLGSLPSTNLDAIPALLALRQVDESLFRARRQQQSSSPSLAAVNLTPAMAWSLRFVTVLNDALSAVHVRVTDKKNGDEEKKDEPKGAGGGGAEGASNMVQDDDGDAVAAAAAAGDINDVVDGISAIDEEDLDEAWVGALHPIAPQRIEDFKRNADAFFRAQGFDSAGASSGGGGGGDAKERTTLVDIVDGVPTIVTGEFFWWPSSFVFISFTSRLFLAVPSFCYIVINFQSLNFRRIVTGPLPADGSLRLSRSAPPARLRRPAAAAAAARARARGWQRRWRERWCWQRGPGIAGVGARLPRLWAVLRGVPRLLRLSALRRTAEHPRRPSAAAAAAAAAAAERRGGEEGALHRAHGAGDAQEHPHRRPHGRTTRAYDGFARDVDLSVSNLVSIRCAICYVLSEK